MEDGLQLVEKEEAPKCTFFVFWMVLAEVRGWWGHNNTSYKFTCSFCFPR